MSTSASAPLLIILGGLPGTGKTSAARELARQLGAVHVRLDSIEQALRAADPTGEIADRGYRVAYAVAEDNLRVGRTVIADSVNPLAITREAWRAVAVRTGAPYLDVELVCSDREEHRRRVETRSADIAGHRLPTWEDVSAREYDPWNSERLVIDTGNQTPAAAASEIRAALER